MICSRWGPPARHTRPREPKGAGSHAHEWATRCAPEVGRLLAVAGEGRGFRAQLRAVEDGGTQRSKEGHR